MPSRPRIIAFSLPHFHPIPENDEWWGKGFTEWTNVGKAKPLFWGHYQPRVPADLGYYDLRVPETREAQAKLARETGIEGFCYWHYWFGNGRQLLERPFNEVLVSGKPDFPFCLAWANESWKGFAHGLSNRNVLIEQTYPGIKDYVDHFNAVLPALKDKRYITVDGKPLFVIYKPLDSEKIKDFIRIWIDLAKENGLPGIYFVGHSNCPHDDFQRIFNAGCVAINIVRLAHATSYHSLIAKAYSYINHRFALCPEIYFYKSFLKRVLVKGEDAKENIIPTIIPRWDHTPRSGRSGSVLVGENPVLFRRYLQTFFENIKNKKNNIVFLKSWNEWAEGNYVEPDLKFGTGYLDELNNVLQEFSK
jgi:hypothetical protein